MSGESSVVSAGRTVMSAQPYPWPYHGAFEASRCALLACLDPSWRSPRQESAASDARLRLLSERLRAAGALIVAIRTLPRRSGGPGGPGGLGGRGDAGHHAGGHDAQGTGERGVDADVEITAGASSAFYGSPLDLRLRATGRSDLIVAGWGLEGPVHSTLRDANDRGYECLLVPDACTPIDPELTFAACETVRFSGGIFGAFADTSSVLDAIDKT